MWNLIACSLYETSLAVCSQGSKLMASQRTMSGQNGDLTSQKLKCFNDIYVLLNFFLSQAFFSFFFQLRWHTLPYPETKEKFKLPELNN